MNFALYRDEILLYLPTAKSLLDEEILLVLNTARQEICSFFDPIIQYVSFETVPLQQEYNLSTILQNQLQINFFESVNKVLHATYKLGQFQYSLKLDYKENIPITNVYSFPQCYYLKQDILGLYPIPSEIGLITLKLSLNAPNLNFNSQEDKHLIPYKHLIIFLACEKIALFLGNAELAIFFRDILRTKMHLLRTNYR